MRGIPGFFTTAVALITVLAIPALAGPADLAVLDKPADGQELRARVAALSQRLQATPKDAALYTRRGEAWFRLRELDRAIDDFNRAIALDKNHDEAYFGRGMALGRNGEIEKGIADLGVYIARNPKSSLAYTKRGVRYLWLGDLDRAGADLHQAVALDPRNAEAHDDLGVVYAQRGDYADALRHFSTTVRLDPGYQKAWHNLAMVLHIQGNEKPALEAADRSLHLNPEDRSSLLLKSEILAALGRTAEAKAALEGAELLPEGNWSEQMSIR